MTKKITTITILTILTLTIIAGGFWYTKNQQKEKVAIKEKQEQGQKQKENNNQQNIEELKVEDIDTSNWKEYCNKKYGFCVKYPEGWEVIKQNIPQKYLAWKDLVLLLNIAPMDKPTNYKPVFTLSIHSTTQSPRNWYINHIEDPEDSKYQGTYKSMKINNLETYYIYEDKSYKSMNYVTKINKNTILFIGFRPKSSDIPYDFAEYIPYYQNFVQSIKTN